MAAKKKTKKNASKTNVKKESIENKTTLGDIIKDADQAVVVTSNKGVIDVTAIKNINYSYEAKGLLVGAMDNYQTIPVIKGLNNNTRVLISHIMNLSKKIDKALPVEELKVD